MSEDKLLNEINGMDGSNSDKELFYLAKGSHSAWSNWSSYDEGKLLELFEQNLNERPLPTVMDSGFRTAMHWAANSGKVQLMKFLVNKGWSAMATDAIGRTPLMYAKNVETARVLIDLGASDHKIDDSGKKASDYARIGGMIEIGDLLGADVSSWKKNKVEDQGMADIYFDDDGEDFNTSSSLSENEISIRSLKNESGLAVTEADKFLMLEAHNIDCGRKWEYGGFHAFRVQPTSCQVFDGLGRTALHWAVTNNKVEMVEFLIENGWSVHVKDEDECTPLLLARNVEIINLLLEKGALPNVKDQNGETFLMKNAHKIKAREMKSWLTFGVDLSTKDFSGSDLLFKAVAKSNHRILKSLVKKGLSYNRRNGKGYSPLDIAALSGSSKDTVLELLKLGADMFEVDKEGRSAIDKVDETLREKWLALFTNNEALGFSEDIKKSSNETPLKIKKRL